LEYLIKQRELSKETILKFRLGYAPDDWTALSSFLRKKGYTPAELSKAGLANIGGRSGLYDLFRGRVMFPVLDAQDRPVGFSGRVLQESAHSGGKYINTPQTAIYDKSRIIYGLAQAREAIVLSTVGMAACVVGVYAATLLAGRRAARAGAAPGDAKLRTNLALAGFWCVVVSVMGWVAIAMLAGGPGLLVTDYITWLTATLGMPTIWVYYGGGVGMSLLALGAPRRARRAGYAIFCCWALIAFPLGLRGEVLFPLTTALMVNPYDARGMAHAIQQAFNMPLAERRERHQAMIDVLKVNSITAWHTSFVDTLDSVAGRVPEFALKVG
jgi:hypothetical protein